MTTTPGFHFGTAFDRFDEWKDDWCGLFRVTWMSRSKTISINIHFLFAHWFSWRWGYMPSETYACEKVLLEEGETEFVRQNNPNGFYLNRFGLGPFAQITWATVRTGTLDNV